MYKKQVKTLYLVSHNDYDYKFKVTKESHSKKKQADS